MQLIIKCLLIAFFYGDQLYSDGESYREASIYDPIHYKLNIIVPNKTLTSNSNEFSGSVEIRFKVNKKTNIITLHAHKDYINITNVSINKTILDEKYYSMNDATHTLNIRWRPKLYPTSIHTLVVDYNAKMSTTDMLGMYKTSYIYHKGVNRFAIFTNFDRSSPRRVFPCFDEPQYRATFDVSLTIPYRKYANSELVVKFSTADMEEDIHNDTTLITFDRTPKLPTYLLSFSISKFYCDGNIRIMDEIDYSICWRDKHLFENHFVKNCTFRLWEYFNNFTSYDLYTQRLSKVDQIVIPDSRATSTGKWGMLTYSENDIYWNETESSYTNKQKTAITVANNVAQQWFGDLDALYIQNVYTRLDVMNWRSDLILDAGFATYFSYYATHDLFSEFQLDKQFVIEQLQPSLRSDSFENTHALQAICGNPANIPLKFEPLCKSKGASLLRMIQNFMSNQNFKIGIRKYIHKNISQPEDIWDSLNGADNDKISLIPEDLSKVMKNWINEPGYPLLTARLHGRKVSVTQEKFSDSGKGSRTRWYVPISFTYGRVDTGTNPLIWLKPNDGNLDLISLSKTSDWVILSNEATGYYRVNYDDTLWNNIVSALLKDNFGGISEINRAQLVDDSFHLARVGKIKFYRLFDNISFLKKDTSYYSWHAAFQGFEYMLQRFGESSNLGSHIKSDLLELMDALNKTVGVTEKDEDNHISILKQNLVLTWAIKLNMTHFVQDIGNIFYQYRNISERPNKNLRNVIYCNVLRYNQSRDNWDYLMANYSQVNDLPNEQVTIISALGCSNDFDILKSYLHMTTNQDSWIKQEHAALAFKSVYSNSPQGLSLSLKFLVENFTDILQRYQYLDHIQSLVEGIATRFTTDEELEMLKTLLDHPNLPEGLKTSVEATIKSTEENLKWASAYGKDLEFYYKIRSLKRAALAYGMFIFIALCCLVLIANSYFIYKKWFANRHSHNIAEIEDFTFDDDLL